MNQGDVKNARTQRPRSIVEEEQWFLNDTMKGQPMEKKPPTRSHKRRQQKEEIHAKAQM